MENDILQKISKLPLATRIGIFFQILFLIGAAIAFSIIMANKENIPGRDIKFNNFSSVLSELPEDAENAVGTAVYKAIAAKYPNTTIELRGYTVKKDSITNNYNQEKDFTTTTFTVDAHDKGLYEVEYRWSKDTDNEYLRYDTRVDAKAAD